MTAVFSDDRVYRYRLDRLVNGLESKRLAFVLLNPSTADETRDDPTIRRCLGYARAWAFGSLTIANLFAYRATDPRELYRQADPIGPDNDDHILAIADEADVVILAWGNHGHLMERCAAVLGMLKAAHIPTFCLAVTKEGEPGHPLYLPASAQPMLY